MTAMAHLKFYKIGPSWILSCHMGQRFGLIHLSSWKWWHPIISFPRVFCKHIRLVLKESANAR